MPVRKAIQVKVLRAKERVRSGIRFLVAAKADYPELRSPHEANPRSILTAYREGDVTFDEARAELEELIDGPELSSQEIVDLCNELARELYKQHGYRVREGYRFDQAINPRMRTMWSMASVAFELLRKTDVTDALADLEDEDDAD